MLNRRSLMIRALAASTLTVGAGTAHAQSQSFQDFLEGVAAEARRGGVSPSIIQRAFANIRPNDKVIELDRRQPEFTLTWEQYRDGRITAQRVERGRQAYADNRVLLDAIASRYEVNPRVVVAIWGLETNYGSFTGNYNVIEALATLAWEGRRASFYRAELLAALRILQRGDTTPERMRGSWAGAMGHPQFMPSSFERLAVDFDGDGRRDIWDDRADALGSIGNYLAKSGWRGDERWGREVVLPGGLDANSLGRNNRRPLRDWVRMGVASADGTPLPPLDMQTAIVIPSGVGGQAFAVYQNFNVIRRYNPSDYYALVVGLLSDRVA
ncbi:lytic murein transglycosylase [Acetobacteraceae bacterium AT-5844]|nr:lytic murein transglycosylase [Acetobacteraceae bacterium AT-5844]